MEPLVESALRSFFRQHLHAVDSESKFVAWKPDDDANYSWTDGYMSAALFGRVEYRTGAGHIRHSEPLVLKRSRPKSDICNFQLLSFVNEIYFYSRIWPLLRSFAQQTSQENGDPTNPTANDHGTDLPRQLFPEYYNSQVDVNADDFDAVIVLKNLQAEGFVTNARRSFIDYPHLALMMRTLGRFHAHSYRARQREPRILETVAAGQCDPAVIRTWFFQHVLGVCGQRGLRSLARHPAYAGRLSNARAILENVHDYWRRVHYGDAQNPISVICHGDYLRSNVLFRYEGGQPVEARLIDMANAKLASPAVDLALPMYLHADQQTRDEHWDDLIDEYHRSLSTTFPRVRVPSREQIVQQFRHHCFGSYLVASYFLGKLIAQDLDLPDHDELRPELFKGYSKLQIPERAIDMLNRIGGPVTDTALTNIVKDMIDRGFL